MRERKREREKRNRICYFNTVINANLIELARLLRGNDRILGPPTFFVMQQFDYTRTIVSMSRVDVPMRCSAYLFFRQWTMTLCIFLYSSMKQVFENVLLSSYQKESYYYYLMTREHFVSNDYLANYIMNASKILNSVNIHKRGHISHYFHLRYVHLVIKS